jgi:hypothetical protein
MKQSQRQARERLERDIDDAIDIAIARILRVWRDKDTGYALASSVGTTKSEIRLAVTQHLARNWRVSERARGERSTGGGA